MVGIRGVEPLSCAYKAHALTVELDPIVRTKRVPGSLRPYLHHAQCCSASYADACRRVPVRRQEHIALGAGTPGRTRTFHLPVNNRLLYRLSYRGKYKARGPLHLRAIRYICLVVQCYIAMHSNRPKDKRCMLRLGKTLHDKHSELTRSSDL